DGDALTYAIVAGPANGALSGTAPNVTYTPNADYNGADSFTFKANDGQADSNVATVTINVLGLNDPPVAVDDAATTTEDTAVTIMVLVNDSDPEGDTLTVDSVTQPANGSAVVCDPPTCVEYTPPANWSGQAVFSYTVSDGNGGTDTATITVTVTGANDAPVAVDDSVTTSEDTMVTIMVLANDSDPDGDALAVSGVTQGSHGSVAVCDPPTCVEYTPNLNYYGSDSFTYTVSDGKGGTDTATVNVTVTPVNDAPVAVDDSAITDENTAVTVLVLANDSDVDGDALSVASVTQGANGSVANNGGNVTYTPNAGYDGTDSFTYTVSDGKGGTDVATVSVTVRDAVNSPPVAVATADPTSGRVPLTVAFDGSGSYDPDGDAILDWEWDIGDGNSAYGPQISYTFHTEGVYTVTLYVFDEYGNVGSTEVVITVVLNTPPVASDSAVTTNEDEAAAVTLQASDADGDALTYTVVTQPANGALSGTAPELTYTPDENWNGSDSVTFKVTDGMDESGVATVSITVVAVNDVPVADDKSVDAWVDRGVEVQLSASDVEGDALTYAIVSPPANGAVSGLDPTTGTLTYTPDAGYVGNDTFTYVANDGLADSAEATVTMEMAEIRIVYVSTGKPYSLGTAEVGALYYIDRNYTINELDENLDGQVLVRTANNDKYVNAEEHLKLQVGRDVTLSVCYDKRMTLLPNWLDDGSWTLTGEVFAVGDKSASPMLVYERTFEAGEIVLGANRAAGAAGAKSNYVVVARSAGTQGLDAKPLSFTAGPLAANEWLNDGDADGDGLLDGFESYIGFDPNKTDSDTNGVSDENEVGPDGQDMWDMQEDWLTGDVPGDDVPDGDVPGDDVPGDDWGDDVPGGGGGGGGGCFIGTGKSISIPGSVTR
ncbi:Ig-like domain-containing protein, partial [Planctomycetota bacterium]